MKTSFVKKFMVIALALAMVFTFAACGGSNDSAPIAEHLIVELYSK